MKATHTDLPSAATPPLPPEWPSRVVIRHLTQADLRALEWEGEYAHFRRLYAEAHRRARAGRAVLWVAELPSFGVIGQLFVQLQCNRPEMADGRNRAYLYAFRVRPAFRRAGVGTRMLQEAEADLIQRGFRAATINVGRDNLAARRLYERLGYRLVAAEPGRWTYVDHLGRPRTVHEPAWRLEKTLRLDPTDETPSEAP